MYKITLLNSMKFIQVETFRLADLASFCFRLNRMKAIKCKMRTFQNGSSLLFRRMLYTTLYTTGIDLIHIFHLDF